MKKNKLEKIYTILIVMYPFLSMYGFFNTIFTLADVASILFIFVMIISKKISNINFLYVVFSVYIILHALLNFFWTNNIDIINLLGSSFRLLLIYYLLSLNKKVFNHEEGKKFIIYVSVIATVYLLIQFLLSKGGIYLPGGIPGIKSYRSDIYTYIDDVLKYNLSYRPRSFFEEPAHYCQYVLVALSSLLCKEKKNKKDVFLILFIITGVIISMSLIGIIFLLFILLMWIIINGKKYINKKAILLFAIMPLLLFFISTSPAVTSVIKSKFVNQSITEDARFSSINVLTEETSFAKILFGSGLSSEEVYSTGFFRIILSFGIIGLIFAFLVYLYFYKKGKFDKFTKLIMITLFFLTFGSEIIFGKFILIYMCLCKFENDSLVYKEVEKRC